MQGKQKKDFIPIDFHLRMNCTYAMISRPNLLSAEVKNERVIMRIVLTFPYKSALQIWLF